MTDYEVNYAQLFDYAQDLDAELRNVSTNVSDVEMSAAEQAMPNGLASESERQLQEALNRYSSLLVQHAEQHPLTLSGIATSYQNAEDDAHSKIRGFFEGRVR